MGKKKKHDPPPVVYVSWCRTCGNPIIAESTREDPDRTVIAVEAEGKRYVVRGGTLVLEPL